ncbi:CLAVATA3/ESR (CLE)-related protein 44-like [Alnus glutinosa]|uniref:CLAVATA3/ESR (CLE)-related protein 44-like n=1 Tax=Alnus glutinosa TaxID=3517 RepID=UPI002D77029E|nr:CLAVATA3/ESR (CLE)-related protein 44-like [Alnus glutinosa]
MATASKALCEGSTKSLVLFLFIVLLLLVTLFDLRPYTDLSKISKAHDYSSSARRLLLQYPPSTQQSAMELHPERSNSSRNRQYEAAAHEVPSGPNPISNK